MINLTTVLDQILVNDPQQSRFEPHLVPIGFAYLSLYLIYQVVFLQPERASVQIGQFLIVDLFEDVET